MSAGTVSDYTVRPIVLVSLTNLPCWVGWLRVGGLERTGLVCRSGFTVIELSLCTREPC